MAGLLALGGGIAQADDAGYCSVRVGPPGQPGTWAWVGATHPGDAAAVCAGASVNYFGTTVAIIVRTQELGIDGAVVSVYERQCLPYSAWACSDQPVLGPTGAEKGTVGGKYAVCGQVVWYEGTRWGLTGSCD